jgi:hypothetical protein
MPYKSTALERQFCRMPRTGAVKFILLAIIVPASAVAFAASPVMGDRETYLHAANQPKMQDRLRELELFASSTETTNLKIQALELMAWYYKQLGAEAEANRWARQLLSFDGENPLALSVLVENARRANPTAISPETLDLAQRGLRRAERFEKPEGMPDGEWMQLRQRMLGILNGTLGYSSFQKQDFSNARNYLRKAVTFVPDDAYYVYALALANLSGEGGNASEGYWYLARAVNLTQGTPAGKQIADYAAGRYQQAGGTASDWKQFIASATSPVTVTPAVTEPAVNASAAPSAPAAQTSTAPTAAKSAPPATPSQTTERASATMPSVTSAPSGAPSATPPRSGEIASRTPSAQTSSSALPQSDIGKAATASSAPTVPTVPSAAADHARPAENPSSTTEVASLTAPPPVVVVPRAPLSPRDPVSLGILIETNIATQENRSAVIYALVDMVRHLRNADEVFILSFGQQLEFHQDLTQNYDLLEAAMSGITPDEGAALLDAVGFSSGHMARIAKNRNRVLLVISDGRDFGGHTPAYEITNQIDQSGVRIYCIGVGVMDSGGRSRLEQLAARTGGRTTFVDNPLHFRAAARQVAAGLGIEFPM